MPADLLTASTEDCIHQKATQHVVSVLWFNECATQGVFAVSHVAPAMQLTKHESFLSDLHVTSFM